MSAVAARSSDSSHVVTWRVSAPHVKKALAYVQRHGAITAEELVEWDRENGRRLFDWHDASAAESYRMHQARLFLNRFRGTFEKMRVRAHIHVREDAAAGIDQSGYVTVQAIAEHPGMRSQVIADLTRRMRVLASELRFWKLTPSEQAELFDQLAEAMGGARKRRTKAA